jgi:hypothetical protein
VTYADTDLAARYLIRSVLRPCLPGMIVAAAGALLAGPGAYMLALWAGANPRPAFIGALAFLTLWSALAPAMLAAARDRWLESLLVGGAVPDASLIALMCLWGVSLSQEGPTMTLWPSALQIYLLLVAMAIAGIAATRLSSLPAGRYAWASLAAVVLVGLCATPFWTAGWVDDAEDTDAIARFAIRWNPFYSASAAVNDPVQFIWHQDAPRMYDKITRIGTDIPAPAPRWYDATWRLSLVAVGLGLLGVLRGAVTGRGGDQAGRGVTGSEGPEARQPSVGPPGPGG